MHLEMALSLVELERLVLTHLMYGFILINIFHDLNVQNQKAASLFLSKTRTEIEIIVNLIYVIQLESTVVT